MSQGDQTQIKDGELIAAVDMGSNSFHMVVATGGARRATRDRPPA